MAGRMTNETDKAGLAALIAGAEGARIAAFLHASGTEFAPNPFPQSTAGAVRHVAEGNALEYPMRGIATAGLPDLLQAVRALPTSTPLARHILKSEDGAHTCSVYLDGPYGIKDSFASVPVKIGKDGVEDIIELHLTDEENEEFQKSIKVLKEHFERALKL